MSVQSFLSIPAAYAILLLPVLTAAVLFVVYRRNAGRMAIPRKVQPQVDVPSDDQGKPLESWEAGFLIDNQLDGRDVAAAVFSLAVKGHLRMQVRREVVTAADSIVQNEEYRLTPTGKEDSGLTEFEKRLRGYFFEEDGKAAPHLLQAEGWKGRVASLESIVSGHLVDLGYYPARPQKIRRRYRTAGGGLILLIYLMLDSDFDLLRHIYGQDPGAAAYFSFPGAFGLTALILLVASRFMPQRTWKGGAALARVQGFRSFLSSSVKGAGAGSQLAASFETYLPYIVAFGLSARWLAGFEGIRSVEPAWFSSAGDPSGSSIGSVAWEIGRAAARMEEIFGGDTSAMKEAAEILSAMNP